MATLDKLPIIDFGSFDKEPVKVAQQVLDACKSIGFFYMTNHGIPLDKVDNAFEMAKGYFDLPSEEKRKFLIKEDNYGYSELYSETLDPDNQRQGDHKEGFNFKNFIDGKAYAPLPAFFEEREEAVKAFSYACQETSARVLEAFAIALEIPEDQGGRNWFKDRHHYNRKSGQVLRFLKYPRGGEVSYKEPVRAGAHSDYGSLTLLFQKDVPGLEVQASRAAWIPAPLVDGAVLVNVGDLMEFWTNGLFKSTLHRVTFLPEHNHLDRYSIPFFVHPEDGVLLTPIPSSIVPPHTAAGSEDETKKKPIMTAGEHLRHRLKATYSF